MKCRSKNIKCNIQILHAKMNSFKEKKGRPYFVLNACTKICDKIEKKKDKANHNIYILLCSLSFQ